MDTPSYESVRPEQSPDVKREYWDIAFGLQEVDRLKPSKYLRGLSEQHIRGEKTYQQVQSDLKTYYTSHASDSSKEADEVSTAIYSILEDGAFRFDLLTYRNYHKRLFKKLDHNIYHPGEFRSINLRKSEDILNGDSVEYQDYSLLEESLRYDFSEQSKLKVSELSRSQLVEVVANFISHIWQVHPFYEGNTRTTAVFLQKYLRSLGFKVDNEPFEKHALYFRNALVRANYNNYEKGVAADMTFLQKFLENVIFSANNSLINEDLQV